METERKTENQTQHATITKGGNKMKKYKLNERGKIQLVAIGMTVLLLAVTYGAIYVAAAI